MINFIEVKRDLKIGKLLSIHVRTFMVNDLDSILSIERESFDDAWPKNFFIYMYQKTPELFLVAVQEGEISGFVIGELREIMISGVSHKFKVGHILNIAVEKTKRRRGIGNQLMDEVEERFKRYGASRATLEVRESNVAAKRFYLTRGYREIGVVDAYYRNENAIIMSKNL